MCCILQRCAAARTGRTSPLESGVSWVRLYLGKTVEKPRCINAGGVQQVRRKPHCFIISYLDSFVNTYDIRRVGSDWWTSGQKWTVDERPPKLKVDKVDGGRGGHTPPLCPPPWWYVHE